MDLQQAHHAMDERQAMEIARKQRAEKVEQEWRQAQSLLVEATASQEQAMQTQTELTDTIQVLRDSNQTLHEQLQTQQVKSREDTTRLHEALTKAEKQTQALKIQAEATEEEIQRLRADKTASEKQIAALKTQLVSLERQLRAAEALSAQSDGSHPQSMVSPEIASWQYSTGAAKTPLPFAIPPLSSSSKSAATMSPETASSDANTTTPSPTCCVCFKASFGLMKNCQCGTDDCHKRAHVACANRIQPGPSVSHPGTPAPRLPLVLCANGGVARGRAVRGGMTEEGSVDA
jgi:hypothetical protein